MKTISSEIKIDATPIEVWNVLTDYTAYSQWNPFIISMKGDIALNNKIEVKIKPVEGSEMTFNPIILAYIENEEITWEGKLFIKGLFDGKHTFKLVENNDRTTTFIQLERFKGLLIPFFTDMIENKTLKGFHLMNQKLKEEVEKQKSPNFSIRGLLSMEHNTKISNSLCEDFDEIVNFAER